MKKFFLIVPLVWALPKTYRKAWYDGITNPFRRLFDTVTKPVCGPGQTIQNKENPECRCPTRFESRSNGDWFCVPDNEAAQN